MENLEKSWHFFKGLFLGLDKLLKKIELKKVMQMCYIHIFIYAVYILYALEFSLLVYIFSLFHIYT